jgi:hypothetical protein
MRSLTVLLLALPLLLAAPAGHGADDATAHHRKVYAEVNRDLATYQVAKSTFEIAGAPSETLVTTWKENGTLRRMDVRYPGDHGDTVQQFYYDHAGLVFIFETVTTATIDGSRSSRREDRYYFKDGRLIRWLDGEKRSVSPATRDFADKEAELLRASQLFSSTMAAETKSPASKAPPDSVTGRFEGFEEGDYTHLLLKSGAQVRSFFVLRTDESIERLLKHRNRYIGKEIRVYWKSSVEDIPEAGGKTRIDSVVSVQLPQ